MVGTSDVWSIDQCDGSFSSIQSAALRDTFGSGLNTSRYICATCGGRIVARRLKYAPVVSLTRSGGVHCATLPTAAESLVTALLRDGTEPWPAGPRATNSMKRGSFSVVPMFDCTILPPVRTTPPPSARQYSALIASR